MYIASTEANDVISSTYIHIDDPCHFNLFCNTLYGYLENYLPIHNHELVILCIGTDRATGDSLGPLIGYKLNELNLSNVTIYGSLDFPVHAKNLPDIISTIKQLHSNALILSIDACLGTMQNVGCISIGEGSIRPGAGVKKDLPSIGHLHIIGIVNFSSLMNLVVLQNTRLSIVMKMADIVSSGIRYCMWKYNKKR